MSDIEETEMAIVEDAWYIYNFGLFAALKIPREGLPSNTILVLENGEGSTHEWKVDYRVLYAGLDSAQKLFDTETTYFLEVYYCPRSIKERDFQGILKHEARGIFHYKLN